MWCIIYERKNIPQKRQDFRRNCLDICELILLKRKIIFIFVVFVTILLTGCVTRYYTKDVRATVFPDQNNSVLNEKECIDWCKSLESLPCPPGHSADCRYICEYDPVTCDNGICLCNTW